MDGTVTVLDEKALRIRLETEFELSIAPNPLRAAARGSLVLQEAQTVRATLYDVLGRAVRLVHDGPMSAGSNRLQFGAGALESGRYFLRVEGESFSTTTSVTVVR
jgi:hypothetical protein